MERLIIRDRRDLPTLPMPTRAWEIASLLAGCFGVLLSVAMLVLDRTDLSRELLGLALLMFCLGVLLHGRFLHQARKQYRHTRDVLQATEREFKAIFENALDTILIVDGQAICRDANPSALELLGVCREDLIDQPISRFYPNRREFETLWERLLIQKRDRGQSELTRRDGAAVFAEFTVTAHFLPGRHMMILRDITQRRRAEEAMGRNLELAKSAWLEADAQRKATLALTQDLRMNNVLDTLLGTLSQLVPFEAAQVLLLETNSKLFLAREVFPQGGIGKSLEFPKTLDASEYLILQRALRARDGVLILDTLDESDWRPINGTAVRSWLGVPLLSSNQVLGLLSLAHAVPGHFSREHLRIAGSLSIAAAVAIQNARLFERAEIYGTELERRLSDLHEVEQALEYSVERLKTSEERFQKLFRWTPTASCVTTLAEGRFIDANEAFERRYGYTRTELMGQTATDLGFWENPQERKRLVEQLQGGGSVRGALSRFRAKSGEFKASLYSAEMIQLDGQTCLLAVFDDLPQRDSKYYN